MRKQIPKSKILPEQSEEDISTQGSQKHFHYNNYQNLQFERKYLNYNPDQLPADFNQAIVHQKATLVGKYIQQLQSDNDLEDDDNFEHDQKKDVCPCCTRHPNRVRLSLGCSLKDLAYMGSGYPLYFYYIKFCFVLLLILTVAGGYNLVTNIMYGEDCVDKKDILLQNVQCETDWVTEFSLGNKASKDQYIDWQNFFNLGSIGLTIFFFQIFRRQIKILDVECDIADVSSVDYTVYVKNIPLSYKAINDDYDEDLQDFIENQLCDGEYQFKIKSINLAYDFQEVKQLEQEKIQLLKEKGSIVEFQSTHGYFEPGKTISVVNEKLNIIQEKINDFFNKFEDGKGTEFMEKYFCGQAFVTFNDPEAKNLFLDKYSDGHFFQKKPKTVYKNQRITFEEAPDPLNIFWENLKEKNQFVRFLFMTFVVLLYCGVSGVSVYFLLKDGEPKLKELYDNGSTSFEFAIDFLVSAIINMFNIGVLMLGKYISKFENHHTRTQYNISAIKKIALAQFVITVCIIITIQLVYHLDDDSDLPNYSRTFSKGGLAYKANSVIIGNVVFPFLAELFDIKQIFKKISQFVQRRKFKNKQPILKTQEQLNKMYENIDFNIVKRYTVILKTMYVVSFYANILPISLGWGIVSVIITYWVDKYNLLRRRSVLNNMSSKLATEMVEMLEFVLIIYAMGNYISMVYIIDEDKGHQYLSLSALGVGITILHAILPMEWVNSKIFKEPYNPPNKITCSNAEINFITDYARENPATSRISKKNHLEKLKVHILNQREIAKKKRLTYRLSISKRKLDSIGKFPLFTTDTRRLSSKSSTHPLVIEETSSQQQTSQQTVN